MLPFNFYPYTDFHEMNLDMILAEIKRLHSDYDEFKALNTITFSGAWDITKQYPSWTIVNVNGTDGYISVKPVPAGINYTNTEYWKLVVDYTVTMADLQNRVVALENETAPIIADYDLYKNMKILFVGDSYSGTSHWTYKTGDLFGLVNGDSYFVNAVGGEGFTIGTGGNGFLDELVQFNADPDVPNDEITHIIVAGGANDALDDSVDIPTGISDFMTYAKTHFPNATVYLGFIGAILGMGSEVGTRTPNYLQRACFMYSSIVNYGGRYMAGLEFTLHKVPALLDAGGLHPTGNGGDAIAKSIYNIINGFNPINEWITQDVTLTPSLAGDTSKTMVRCNYGETAKLSLSTNTLVVNPTAVTEFTGAAAGTEIYTMSGIYFNRMYIVHGLSAMAQAVGLVPVDLIFLYDKIYVRVNVDSGGNFGVVNTQRLIIRNFSLVIPLLDIM